VMPRPRCSVALAQRTGEIIPLGVAHLAA
jgi:hypothetical protein